MASTELVVAQPELTAPTSYPVDAITEAQDCHLLAKLLNLKPKAAIGNVLPPRHEGTFHSRPIPQGYAVVMVDEIVEGYEELELDYPTGDGDSRLSQALKTAFLCRKELIKLAFSSVPSINPPPPPPPSRAPACPINPLASSPAPPINSPPPPPSSPEPARPISPPAPARPISPPPPSVRQQGQKRSATPALAAPARNNKQ